MIKKYYSKIFFVLALILILTTALLYLYNIFRWRNYPDFGFYRRTATGIRVIGVITEQGHKAGLEVGDVILKVNEKGYTDNNEFRDAQNDEIGDKNTYLIDRSGRQFEVTITNEPLGLWTAFIRSGLPYLVGLCYILIGTLVFLMKPYQRTSWIFFIFGATFGLLLAFLLKLGELKPFWLGTLHIFFYTFTPAVFIHLALSFPEERSLIKSYSYRQIIPYFASALLFLGIRYNASILADVPKIWSLMLMTYLLVSVLIFLGSCLQLWLTSKSEIVRVRSKMILLGAFLTASVPLVETVINALFHVHIVPSFNYYLPFLIIFPLSVGYSIVKHNLFEIDTIIKRTYGYVLTTGTIAGIYGLIVLISNLAFRRLEITKSPLFPLLFVLAVVFLFNPIRNRVQKVIDRVFYRLEYDYQETIQKISESLRSLLSLDEIGKRIMDHSLGVMFIESGSVMVLNPEAQGYESLMEPESKLKLPDHDPLLQKISEGKKEVTRYDIEEDPLFEKVRALCKKTFERLGATLIVPLIYEDRLTGILSLGNKKSGKFYRREDINLLKILANQGAVAIENARLHQARIEALEQSRKELEQLNKAKGKALDHLSHELRTPLAVIQGNIRLLKRKAQQQPTPLVREEIFDSLDKNLTRLSDIQQETDQIIRSYQELEKKSRLDQLDLQSNASAESISLFLFTEQILEGIKQKANHRDLQFQLDGEKDLTVLMDPKILEEVLIGLLKNAVENTPDEGLIRTTIEQKAQWIQLKVQDFGIGITHEHQRHILDGLFHTLDTELYTSKKPYDFGAGGKGLDLLRIKTYGQRFGFDLTVGSQRCTHLPTERDLCPGKISSCPYCKKIKDCLSSGGSTFCVSFPMTGS